MRLSPFLPLLVLYCDASAQARDVPQNLRDLYDGIRNRGSCSNKLASGFWASGNGPDAFSYCGDYLKTDDVIYIQGKDGALADMDIDCDGIQGGPGDDGRCALNTSPDYQPETSFRTLVSGYRAGINELNTYVHPYVVFGNTGRKRGWRTFDPTSYGVQPLSVMAVVCGNQLVYGVWGDTNGDDGNHPMVGEASLALATACQGTSMTGANGYSRTDILYLAFTGKEAVPGPRGADWNATDFDTFEKSIESLGNRLVERISSSACKRPAELGTAIIAAILGMLWVALQ